MMMAAALFSGLKSRLPLTPCSAWSPPSDSQGRMAVPVFHLRREAGEGDHPKGGEGGLAQWLEGGGR